jgi:hypothetical protein
LFPRVGFIVTNLGTSSQAVVNFPQGVPLSDVYFKKLTGDWDKRPGLEDGNVKVIKNTIGTGVACCGPIGDEKLFIVITTTTMGKAEQHDTIMSQLTNSTDDKDVWDAMANPARPTEFSDSNHSITMVGFKNRLYLRYLNMKALRGRKIYTAPLYVYVRDN